MRYERFSGSDRCVSKPKGTATKGEPTPSRSRKPAPAPATDRPKEYGGRKGPDPVRYGDWEKNGRCIDF